MKKAVIIVLIIFIFLFSMNAASVRALHPETPIFEEASFSSAVLFHIPQNAYVIELNDAFTQDNTSWQQVQYGSYVGFVDASALYQIDDEVFSVSFSRIKATSRKMGEEIKLYAANSVDSSVVDKVKDGTRLQLVESAVDYGDFLEIVYNGQRAFIPKEHATASLTYNEKTALIIGAATLAVLTAMICLTLFIIRTRKKRLSPPEEN